eukprot:CAMPEP_0172318214 /NCGR_PEP_ID=MMETSP1058-20130122/34187_1 /TAXON_ID=83371 /ORGANISM="Detonula confervacea, Strain CCMP 353" /LENGTH=357 /DNA_ID=CAMNT_0013032975 /DNA_START=109 /DNA_END=1182 /DNA_ORIENTATION=-
MDHRAVLATPSLKLTMVSSTDYQSSDSPRDNALGGIIHGVNPPSSRELIYDQLCNMIVQEARDGYKSCDYLRYYSTQSEKPKASQDIDEGCRTSICGWMYRVADHFAIDREVVSIALSYIDRVLSSNYCTDRRTFKLISATCLHLAIKTHFPHMWREVGSLLPDLSRGDFVLDDLVGMEKEVTHSLAWLMNPATSQSIVMHLLSLLPSGAPRSIKSIASMALFLVELSVCDYFFVTSRRSIVAIAAMLNASESAGFIPFQSTHGADEIQYQNDWHTNIEGLLSDIGYFIDWLEISSARDRLWSLYRQSSESAPETYMDSPVPSRKTIHGSSAHQEILQDYPSPTTCIDHRMRGFSTL